MTVNDSEHRNGGVEFVEGRQVRSWCSCGWSTLNVIPTIVDFTETGNGDDKEMKAQAMDEAERQLNAHQKRHTTNPDKGVQL
jgi:hypothetical protein